MGKKLNIAFVVQRYGLEVNGGAELHCRQVAEKLAKYHNVEILTTCAIDYNNWRNEYPAGTTEVNGITVRRFPVEFIREEFKFNVFSLANPTISLYGYVEDINWMWQQGPLTIELVNYLKYNKFNYDVFIFMTYLYFTTYAGISIVPEKSILIPTAHDEEDIYRDIFNSVFNLPRAIFYNTLEEKKFVESRFHSSYIPNDIGGVGVEIPEHIDADAFRKKYELDGPFLLYIGRITNKKGCDVLFRDFLQYKQENNSPVKLVLMGKSSIEIPDHPDIISLGFVSDEDKFNGLSACSMLVLPSEFESLSMVLLESFSLKKCALVNGKCSVLKSHCELSNGGLYYESYTEFAACLDILLNDSVLCEKLGKNAKKYVEQYYNWDTIIEKLNRLIDRIADPDGNTKDPSR